MQKVFRFIVAVIIVLMSIELAHSKVERIVIHTTYMPKHCGARCIDIYHRKVRGWNGCGYHRVVRHTGAVEKCREYTEVGAHVKEFNEGSIGVAWSGMIEPTKVQMEAMEDLVVKLLKKFNLKPRDIYGHRQFPTAGEKTCPNIDMNKFRRKVYWKFYEG
jgi:N-acetylmuramoyl-L-alanine amidase